MSTAIKELWLYTNSLGQTFCFESPQTEPGLHGEFHVIEYSAYERLKDRSNQLQIEQDHFIAECDRLKAAVDRLQALIDRQMGDSVSVNDVKRVLSR